MFQQLLFFRFGDLDLYRICFGYTVLFAGDGRQLLAASDTGTIIGRAKSVVAHAQLVGDIVIDTVFSNSEIQQSSASCQLLRRLTKANSRRDPRTFEPYVFRQGVFSAIEAS